MPVRAWTRLGPYQIVAPLGAGGMGEVFRARSLGRAAATLITRQKLPCVFALTARVGTALHAQDSDIAYHNLKALRLHVDP